MENDPKPQPELGSQFERLIAGLAQQGTANLVLSMDETGTWVGLATFGEEAPDSDMAGGSTTGMGTLDEVLANMVDEGGW